MHKGTWRSPDGDTVITINHVLIDARHYSDILDVRSRRKANINSDHFLVKTKIRAKVVNI